MFATYSTNVDVIRHVCSCHVKISPKIRKAFRAVFHMGVPAWAFAGTDHTDAGFRILGVIFLCFSSSDVTVPLLCPIAQQKLSLLDC